MSWRRVAVVCLVGSVGCRNAAGSVQSLTVAIAVTPATLEFGSVYLEAVTSQTLSIQNQGTAQETATVTFSNADFTAAGGPTFALPPGTTTSMTIVFNPTAAAVVQASAHVAWDEGSADVALTGTGLAWPDCVAPAQCEQSAFDPKTGTCEVSQLADGAACDGGSDCLQDARCQAGQCVGEPLDCNDDNACTQDYCVEGQGCVHQDTGASCTGTDPCQVYSCDPSKGCTSSNAPNGTLCSNDESCQTAQICLLGQCIGTPVPDGFPCGLWWAPCVTDAECHGGTCDSPTADAEKPGDVRWTWQPDAGGTLLPTAIDVPAVDELGNSYVCGTSNTAGWESAPMDLVSLDQCGVQRWENPDFHGVTSLLLAGKELLFVDPLTNDLVALYRDSGQVLWQTNLAAPVSGASPDGGTLACYQIQINSLALSPTGPIYAAGTLANACESGDTLPEPFLAAILPNGTVSWSRLVPGVVGFDNGPEAPPFGQGLMVDSQGNAYLYEGNVSPDGTGGIVLGSFDPSGATRFGVGFPATNPVLALGTDRFVEATSGSVWLLDGGYVGALDGGLAAAGCPPGADCVELAPPPTSVAIDALDDIFVLGDDGSAGWGLALTAYSGLNPTWSLSLPSTGATSNVVLGQGQLFVTTTNICEEGPCPCGDCGTPLPPGSQLFAVDSASGSRLWATQLATPAYSYPPATMTLANTATLLLAGGGQVTALFAGEQAPPQNAPWSRVGGSYWNQSSSAPPATPSLPTGGDTP